MTININDMTIGQVREIAALLGLAAPTAHATPATRLPIGQPVCIETVLGHYVGRLVAVDSLTYWLDEVAWIPSTGRYHLWAAGADPDEIEPLPAGVVGVERSQVLLARPHPRVYREAR